MVKLKKKKKPSDDKLKQGSTGKFEDLSDEDKLAYLAESYKLAKNATPDYEKLKAEIEEFEIDIPEEPDVANISEINKLFALGQSYSNRVGTIKRIALSNIDVWQQLISDMKMYVSELEWKWEDLENETMMLKEVKGLPNDKMRKAYVQNQYPKERKRLRKIAQALSKVEKYLNGAKSFKNIVEVKEKELVSALMNLNRQVEAIKTELQISRN